MPTGRDRDVNSEMWRVMLQNVKAQAQGTAYPSQMGTRTEKTRIVLQDDEWENMLVWSPDAIGDFNGPQKMLRKRSDEG